MTSKETVVRKLEKKETRHAIDEAAKKLISWRNKVIWHKQNNNKENTLRSYKDDINNGCRLPTDISAVVKLSLEFSKCPSAKETSSAQLRLILNTTQQMSGKLHHYVLKLGCPRDRNAAAHSVDSDIWLINLRDLWLTETLKYFVK